MSSSVHVVVESAEAAADKLGGRRFVASELMYRPRPTAPRPRAVFDFALRSRWDELSRTPDAAVLLVCRDSDTLASLQPLMAAYPSLRFVAAVVNPSPLADAGAEARVPWQAGWDTPDAWQRYDRTDRWARIGFALDVARRLDPPGYLALPAHDAVWGIGLLARLVAFSRQNAQRGVPAVVSPYTVWQHSPVPNVDIPPSIIAALNAGFNRDSAFRERIEAGTAQGFWGKTGLLPFVVCDTVLRQVEMQTWEDDLEIDRVLKAAGYPVLCLWVEQRALYRQALPVFDRAGLARVFDRTLHYSLNLPAAMPAGTSLLNQPLDALNRLRRQVSRRYDAAVRLSEAVIADCNAQTSARLARTGLSWVDWGDYRYVTRVGDPWVQIWKNPSNLL